MILADSSIWIDHFKVANLAFSKLIRTRQVLMHPFVVGELALGSLKDREQTIVRLGRFKAADLARHDEVMAMIEAERLFSRGLGYVDAHLLASTRISKNCKLLTRDRRLREAAEALGIAA